MHRWAPGISLGVMYVTLGKVHCGMKVVMSGRARSGVRDGTLGKAHCSMRNSRIPEMCYKT